MRNANRSLQTLLVAITTAVFCFGLIQLASAQEAEPVLGSSLSSTFGSSFVETNHQISMTTDGPVARLTVLRAFKNEGLRIDEVSLTLDMPVFASITGAKIYNQGIWKDAEFKKTAEAEKIYNKKEEQKVGHRFLMTKERGQHIVLISPVLPSETVIISYDVEVEMAYDAGYSFAWDLAPNGLETENLSAVQFSSDRQIQIKGIKRLADEQFTLLSNRCEEKGFVSDCQFVEIDNPFTESEKISFSFTTTANIENVKYQLFTPSGEPYLFAKNSLRALQTTIPTYQTQMNIRNVPGVWRFVASPTRSEKGRSESDVIRVKLGNIEAKPLRIASLHQKNGKEASDNRIYILDSEHPKGRIRYGTFKSGKVSYSKIDISMPEKFSELPKAATMIFLIDSSISQTRAQLSHQLDLVKSITSHTDDEEVILINYNRHAKKMEFSPDKLQETLSELKAGIRLENGSDIGAALSLAGEYIKKIPNEKPVLVYAMTDLLFKKSMTQEFLMPKISNFKANAILHIIEVREDIYSDTGIERDDEIEISGLSRQTTGVSVIASFSEEKSALLLDKETLYLVRPTRVERTRLSGFGALGILSESESISRSDWEHVGKEAVLEGELWSRPFIMKTHATTKTNVQTMRYALNDSPSDANLGYPIARRAGVVSEYTSLVTEGDRIQNDVVQPLFGSGYGMGMRGSGSVGCGGVRMGFGSRKKVKPDYSGFFSSVARSCEQKHPGSAPFRTKFETTGNEIVDVQQGKSAYEKCVVEGVWDTHLMLSVKTGQYTLVFQGRDVSQL